MKAVSSTTKVKPSDSLDNLETEAEESGIQTLTSETLPKDDTSGFSDETISVETIHFGKFYSHTRVQGRITNWLRQEKSTMQFSSILSPRGKRSRKIPTAVTEKNYLGIYLFVV